MSVRRRKERDPKTGAVYEVWTVDVVFKHPDGRRTRVKRKSPVQTRRGAEAYEREIRNALLAGTSGRKEDEHQQQPEELPTLRQFAPEFIETYAETNNKASEVSSKRQILYKHVLPELGGKRLHEIGTREVEGYKSLKIKAGYQPKTVNNHLAVLRRMIVVAVEWGMLEQAPTIRGLRVPPQKFDFLTFEEADQLVAAADEWRPMITTAIKTGLRMGELRALLWEDLDLVNGRVNVRRNAWQEEIDSPKNNRYRDVPLSRKTVAVLRELPSRFRGELVFCKPADGSMLTVAACVWGMRRSCKRAGLRSIGWHVARHSFGSHLAMRGVPIRTISELMGHSTIQMTMRYAHLSPDVARDAVELLDVDLDADDVHGHVPMTDRDASEK